MKYISLSIVTLSLLFSSALFTYAGDNCVDIPVVLKYQSKDVGANKYVFLLQGYLYNAGYLSAKPTGFFGTGTVNAVKLFQKANGITETGSLGPITRLKVKEMSCNVGRGTTSQSSNSEVMGKQDMSLKIPTLTLTGMNSNRVKTVLATDNITLTWSAPSITNYKLKAVISGDTSETREYPITLTTWTGSIKDLLTITSGTVSISVKSCTTDNMCGTYSNPVTVYLKN